MTATSADAAPGATSRPRITGPREDEILDAALALLGEVGYDRFTMDAVAAAAHAGKASLYRRWRNKAELVVDAFARCEPVVQHDTGSLRGDLMGMACDKGGMLDRSQFALMASLLTALHHDAELQLAFQDQFLAPRHEASRQTFARAKARGEISSAVDSELLIDILPSILIQRVLLRGAPPSAELIERVVDEIVLPAARRTLT